MNEPVLIDLNRFVDDRGIIDAVFSLRDFPNLKRQYLIRNGWAVVRAWHGHKFESKIIIPITGRFKIGCFKMDDVNETITTKNLKTFYLTPDKPQALFIPAGWYHGFKSWQEGILLVCSDKTTEESKADDFRMEWCKPVGHHYWEVDYR